MIKAIETEYNGYKFRSRLEARWAVFFDAMGIEYQYEPEGFVGLNNTAYLPDFYLPKEDVFVEVKGTDDALKADGYKIAAAIDFEATPVSGKGLLILGDIPNPEQISFGNIPMFAFLSWHKGIMLEYAVFTDKYSNEIIHGNDAIIKHLYSYDWDYSDFYGNGTIPEATSTSCKWTYSSIRSYDNWSKLKEAYRKARQARFEHGEKPII